MARLTIGVLLAAFAATGGQLPPAAKGDPPAIALSMWAHVHGFMSLHLMGRFGDNRTAARALYDASMQRLLDGLYP